MQLLWQTLWKLFTFFVTVLIKLLCCSCNVFYSYINNTKHTLGLVFPCNAVRNKIFTISSFLALRDLIGVRRSWYHLRTGNFWGCDTNAKIEYVSIRTTYVRTYPSKKYMYVCYTYLQALLRYTKSTRLFVACWCWVKSNELRIAEGH